MLNTMTSAHNKIFGAKFLSFERLEAMRLYTACYAVLLPKRYKIRLAKPYFFSAIEPLLHSNTATFSHTTEPLLCSNSGTIRV